MPDSITCSESCKVSGVSGRHGVCGKRIEINWQLWRILYVTLQEAHALSEGRGESRKEFNQRNSVMSPDYEKSPSLSGYKRKVRSRKLHGETGNSSSKRK